MRTSSFPPDISLRPVLLRWFRRHARLLPWRIPSAGRDALWPNGSRLRRSPYATWVAEIMLQQTQVSTVVPYFEKWMLRFPDMESLARAPEEDVMRHWAGLGYYARAGNMRRAAQIVFERQTYPDSAEGWLALPGIGPYTAGAVASLAFDLPEPVLDGNVIRVLSRLFGLRFLPGDGTRQRAAYWELARLWASGRYSGDVNEALMELGAMVCIPAVPHCAGCPLASGCQALKRGLQNSLPPVKRRPAAEEVRGVVVVAENRNRILTEVRPRGGFLAGHAMFPLFLGAEAQRWRNGFLKRVPGSECARNPRMLTSTVKHSIMHRRYLLQMAKVDLRVSARKGAGADIAPLKWIHRDELEGTFTNSLVRKIWKAAGMG